MFASKQEQTMSTSDTLREFKFIDLIYSHVSVRSYTGEKVSDDVVRTIVEAGQHASTSSNLQQYSVICTRESAKRNTLAEFAGGQNHVAEAPVFLTWCVDMRRLNDVCEEYGWQQENALLENFLTAAIDTALAAQNAALAAEALNLGICYIGGVRNHIGEVIALLKIPKFVFPLFGMTIGYTAERKPDKPRLPLTGVLHWEAYADNPVAEAVAKYDITMQEAGIYRGRGLAESGEAYSWKLHSARRVSSGVRKYLRRSLQTQGLDVE
jgi:FMN reductase (NADPH)